MATLIIRPRARLFRGHEWVYATEVQKTLGSPQPGDIVSLCDHKSKPLGSAIYNPRSQIIARRFSRRKQDLDAEFFLRRLQRANEYRQRLFVQRQPADVYRLVWSESDGLPGLIIDRYGPHYVVQTLTLAMDQRLELIINALRQICEPASIIERNDAPIRTAEGLPLKTGVLWGEAPAPFQIDLPTGSFTVDLLHGQKTGLYLDQLDNYAQVAAFAAGRRVLDCFCNQGGFALACAKAGALSVTGVDSSEAAISAARENAQRTGVAHRCTFRIDNVFDFLKAADNTRNATTRGSGWDEADDDDWPSPASLPPPEYDLIILDPPSFARNKSSLRDALRGYKEIHLRALKLLRPGGLLSTFSCSHHVSRAEFQQMIADAANDAKKTLRRVASHDQRLDHPVLLTLPETEYLKGWTYEVIGSW